MNDSALLTPAAAPRHSDILYGPFEPAPLREAAAEPARLAAQGRPLAFAQ